MKIKSIISFLESFAHPSLQETYDNTGLITGDENQECSGILVSLDTTEEVLLDAIKKKCNLVLAHHPVIFSGLKKINEKNYVGRTIISAIKNDIAIYAIHTNLDNVIAGVNGRIAELLGLKNLSVLSEREKTLKKLFTFVPVKSSEKVRNSIFKAGGGQIGKYSECSFNAEGTGTFKAGTGAKPFVGEIGKQQLEPEIKIEVIFPFFLEKSILENLRSSHPYEEIAYDIISLDNTTSHIGSGIVGELNEPIDEIAFLNRLKQVFNLKMLKHTKLKEGIVKKIAICGGAGSFLIPKALAIGVDFFITSDIKYHEFFEANGKMIIVDIGHYESEQFTISLLKEVLEEKFPTFAVLKTEVNTNPVRYF